MKKLMTVLLSCSMLTILLLTACGGGSGSSASTADAGSSTSTGGTSTSEPADTGSNAAQDLLDEAAAELEKVKEQIEAEGLLVLDVLARDKDTLVYNYKLISADITLDVDVLESELEKQAEVFMNTVEELEKKGAAEAKVIIEYVDHEGKEIYTKVFQK